MAKWIFFQSVGSMCSASAPGRWPARITGSWQNVGLESLGSSRFQPYSTFFGVIQLRWFLYKSYSVVPVLFEWSWKHTHTHTHRNELWTASFNASLTLILASSHKHQISEVDHGIWTHLNTHVCQGWAFGVGLWRMSQASATWQFNLARVFGKRRVHLVYPLVNLA